MKRILDMPWPVMGLLVAALLIMSGCWSGCSPDAVVVNSQENVVTHRQHVVEIYGTAEVWAMPYSTDEYIVRDTNGAIWYVNANKSSYAGRALVFNSKLAPQDAILSVTPLVVTNAAVTNSVLLEDK